MAVSKAAVETYVFNYFRRNWPSAKLGTSLRGTPGLGLDEYDIYDVGRDLRHHPWTGAYTPNEFQQCKKIKDIVDLIWTKVN